jgi:Tol biopolymer transport system component
MRRRRRNPGGRGSVLLAAVFLASACGGGGGGGPGGRGGGDPVALSELYPIDGVVDFTGLETTTVTLSFYDGATFVKDATLTYAMANDDRDYYVALEWTDDTFDNAYDWSGPIEYDGVLLLLDDDANGTYDDGEDARALITATPVGSLYLDQHKGGTGFDHCGDGYGKLAWYAASGKYQAELLFPRFTDAQGEDASISATTRFNLVLFDHAQPAAGRFAVAFLFPSDGDTSIWDELPYQPALMLPVTKIPSDLTGLIAFSSAHEDPESDLYTFDPATRRVTRVTNTPEYEDNVSLSHDRQWIAFHAAPTTLDFLHYEIWKVRVDGTGLTRLTNNSILDGHPGWSPDDSRICYASFRDAGASIVVMTADGVELADLTVSPDDDNDPDYLPDGRIVFKTNRFNPAPKVKMATMNEDGTGVQQVTFDARSPDSSDHDAVGDSTYCIFERLMKGTDYTSDVEALFTPWNVVEARLDGTFERTLIADGWINHLPVYDPTGRHFVFLKNHGFTDVHLATRDGKQLGRLIPNVTRVRYVDWK